MLPEYVWVEKLLFLAKKKQRKNRIIVWLTNRYELIVRNEADFAERRTMTFTYAQVLFVLFFIFATMMGGSLFLSKTLLSKWFNPEYEFNNLKYEIGELAQLTDSLEVELKQKDEFILSVKRVFDPEYKNPIGEDKQDEPIAEMSGEPANSYSSEVVKEKGLNITHQMLIFPIDEYSSLYRDTTSLGGQALLFELKVDENVKSIKDGRVEVCTWDKDFGNVMIVNHNDGLKTRYNGLGVVIKKVGDFVSAGDVIALSGKNFNGENSIVKFEMLFNDRALDIGNYFIIKE